MISNFVLTDSRCGYTEITGISIKHIKNIILLINKNINLSIMLYNIITWEGDNIQLTKFIVSYISTDCYCSTRWACHLILICQFCLFYCSFSTLTVCFIVFTVSSSAVMEIFSYFNKTSCTLDSPLYLLSLAIVVPDVEKFQALRIELIHISSWEQPNGIIRLFWQTYSICRYLILILGVQIFHIMYPCRFFE